MPLSRATGLSWITIKKRARYRTCFRPDPGAFASGPRAVRNRLKLYAIRSNAQACRAVQSEFGSFSAYIWSFVGGSRWMASAETSPASTALVTPCPKTLNAEGLNLCTICYAFMQATGMINDHTRNCFRYMQLNNQRMLPKERTKAMIGYVTLGTNNLHRALNFTMPRWQNSGRRDL